MNTPAPANSNTAIVSLVSGILCWLLLPVLGAIVAIVSGHMARSEIRATPGLGGDAMAIIGLVLGYGQLLLIFASIVFAILFLGGIAALLALFGLAGAVG